MAMKTLPARDGIFIPRELLPVGGEWIFTVIGNQVVLRPKMDRATAHRNLREIRERLKEKYGTFLDSTPLIRSERIVNEDNDCD